MTTLSAGERIRLVYSAFRAGDSASALAHYASDVQIRQAPGTPWEGEYRGLDGFQSFAARLFGAMSGLEIVSFDVVAEGDRVVVIELLRFSRSGRSLEMEAIEVFDVRDDRIARVDVWYRDPEAVATFARS